MEMIIYAKENIKYKKKLQEVCRNKKSTESAVKASFTLANLTANKSKPFTEPFVPE